MIISVGPFLKNGPRNLRHDARSISRQPVVIAATTVIIAFKSLDASLKDLVGSLLVEVGNEADTTSITLPLIQGFWWQSLLLGGEARLTNLVAVISTDIHTFQGGIHGDGSSSGSGCCSVEHVRRAREIVGAEAVATNPRRCHPHGTLGYRGRRSAHTHHGLSLVGAWVCGGSGHLGEVCRR